MYVVRLPALAIVAACSHQLTSGSVELASVTPDLVCNAATTTVALNGDDFTPMPSRTLGDPRLLLPQVTLEPIAALPATPAAPAIVIADDPDSPDTSRVHWASETAMSFDVSPLDALPPGVFDVVVTNPDGEQAMPDLALAIVAPPSVAQPQRICDGAADQAVTVTGAGFLVYAGAAPTVVIAQPAGTKTYAPAAISGCAPIAGALAETGIQLCTSLAIAIPQGDITATASTTITLAVENPAPAGCASSPPLHVTIEMSPCRG